MHSKALERSVKGAPAWPLPKTFLKTTLEFWKKVCQSMDTFDYICLSYTLLKVGSILIGL